MCYAMLYYHRYTMMRKCWEMSSQNRPTFSELHSNISKYIAHIGGYLEMGFDPFKSARKFESTAESRVGKKELEGDGDDSGVAIQVIPPHVCKTPQTLFD